MANEEEQQWQKQLREMEKEVLSWTGVNEKDIIYLMSQKLFSDKNPAARAQAFKTLDRLIEYFEDPNSP
ncbi:MAG: hypothetical protein M3299_01470 [Thermoproteota archaeon]|nr:hypothetical protein [Thermoproteota archaeon]